MSGMKVIMESWDRYLVEATDTGQIADILSRLKSIDDANVTVADLKFLIKYLARDIASGGKLTKDLESMAVEGGLDLGAFLGSVAGVGFLRSGGKLMSSVAKRAKITGQDDATILASLMFVDDAAAAKNPILNAMNIHDAYEGSINPLLNGPFVNFAMEELQRLPDGILPKTWGTETMQKYLESDFNLQTKPTGA
jgi:hypothetical protein